MSAASPTTASAEPVSEFVPVGDTIGVSSAEEAPSAATLGDGPAREEVQVYDFRNPMLLAPGELRKLRLHQEEFIQSAAARLSIHLRLEFGMKLTGIQTIAYQKAVQGWGRPTHLHLFKMDPLRGIAVLEISGQLGLCMVDRLMGGPGQTTATEQEISEIEKVLLEQTAQLFLEEWCGAWAGVKELKPSILGYESNGSYIQTVPTETMMLVISMEAGFGEFKGKIQMCVPFLAMEPIIHRQCQGAEVAPISTAAPVVPTASAWKWNKNFDELCVPVTAEWDGLEMTARQILSLKVGDVLPLEGRHLEFVNVRVSETLKFKGRPGTVAGQWAVELTKVIK